MIRKNTSSDEDSFFNIAHARWVIGVLSMLIAVVGKESLVGLLLRQTQTRSPATADDYYFPSRAAFGLAATAEGLGPR